MPKQKFKGTSTFKKVRMKKKTHAAHLEKNTVEINKILLNMLSCNFQKKNYCARNRIENIFFFVLKNTALI